MSDSRIQDADGPARSRRGTAPLAASGIIVVCFVAALALAWMSAGTLLLIFAGVLLGVFLDGLTPRVRPDPAAAPGPPPVHRQPRGCGRGDRLRELRRRHHRAAGPRPRHDDQGSGRHRVGLALRARHRRAEPRAAGRRQGRLDRIRPEGGRPRRPRLRPDEGRRFLRLGCRQRPRPGRGRDPRPVRRARQRPGHRLPGPRLRGGSEGLPGRRRAVRTAGEALARVARSGRGRRDPAALAVRPIDHHGGDLRLHLGRASPSSASAAR